ncbi:unnamed protein product [Triticum turgidum subsp. durum]|uniref:Uncharacterized protein n=1 Tax=Triticum turgidum subsp. durum TaxID=4567 RepID=A0A9R1RSI3_TRITD|nr:unnamed protein product [Triticum turgidum subsp. durum]
METLQALSNLIYLTECELFFELRGLDGLCPLLSHGRLTKLQIDPHSTRMCPSALTPFSTNPLDVWTGSTTGFLAAPICSLLSSTLTKFELSLEKEMKCFTKEQEEALQLLTSLQELHFSASQKHWPYLSKLQCLPAGLDKLINLKRLTIYRCSSIRSLPSLPSSLQKLVIYDCYAIQSLPNSLPSSLEILSIFRCKAIKSLPDSLPSSLKTLKISSCDAIKSLPDSLLSSMLELDVSSSSNSKELKMACRKLKGTIPIVKA